jgi:hypothetical protein
LKTVRWLHLSDFHVGMDDYGQRKLFREICDHIKGKAEKGYIPDFVFITGDLVNKGLAPQYSDFFDAFLDPMLGCLGASWDGKVVATPGNHDVERARAPYFSREEILAKPQNAFDPTEEGQLAREQLAMRFKNYSDLDMTGAPRRWLESKAGSYSFEINIRGCGVGVVGVNTAWLCKDDHDRHLLTPGVHLLDDALGEIKNSQLKIVLAHHPLDWIEDNQAQQMRVLLGKHSALYLHGHLHANEGRYDDGGQGAFLGIRCGSAFQGRPDDKPPWVNGLLWADVDLDRELIELQPFHWSAQHREWKLTTDAFPNQYESGGKWAFPLPGVRRPVAVPLTTAPSAPRVQPPPEGLRPGWALVDAQFLNTRMSEETEEGLLQFFDGRPPTWRLAQSAARGLVERLRSRFGQLEDAAKPTVVNLLGPSSEGKSTAFLQTVVKLVREDGWVALWRHNDLEQIDADTIRRLARNYPKLVVAVDEAHSLAPNLAILLTRLGSRPTPHFLLCSRSLDWRAEVREMGSITVASDYQEVIARGLDRPDAALIVAAWARLGKEGLGAVANLDSGAAADALLSFSRDLEGEEDEGALFGAMLKLRYGDKLKDRIRSVLYRINDMRAPGRPVLDAYAMIAAMHAEGLRFLSLPVLAEHFGMSAAELRKSTIVPLADEAVAAGGGRYVLCRHQAIAEASVAVLRETNLFGEIDSAFSELCRAAINAR